MGLDMYLNKIPRYKDCTPIQVDALDSYFSWEKNKEEGNKFSTSTLKKWCGIEESDIPPQDVIDYYRPFYITRFQDWDVEHKCGHSSIFKEVGYWRKTNSIHNWFVQNVQDGEDDCKYHNEVTEELLQELLNVCEEVVNASTLTPAVGMSGTELRRGKTVPIYQIHNIIADSEVARDLLPSASGFFFGGTDYDEYYLDDIKETIKIIQKVLETTNFETEAIYYRSSW